METLLIFTLLLTLSAVISSRFIKRSLIIKNHPFNPPNRIEEFKTLILKAHQDFLFPKKFYVWTQELNPIKKRLEITPITLKMFLDSLSEASIRNYFDGYELVLYWHITERKNLKDLLEEINPELYKTGIEKLEARISHHIMESFEYHPSLMQDLNNFLFYESLNQKKLLK